MSKEIKWLHISDFHVGKDDYENNKIFDYIIKHIEETKKDFKPDFIFITGDIANKGLEKEYQQFTDEFLLPLIVSLDIDEPEEKIFIVPGNHDLERVFVKDVDYETRFKVGSKFFNDNKDGQKERSIHEARAFENYSKFIDNTLSKELNLIEKGKFSKKLNIKGINIGIAGINTAWVSRGNEDKEKLSPGIDLLKNAINDISECDIKILLGHHPLDWIYKDHRKSIESILSDNNVIYLHGHLHENMIQPTEIGNNKFLGVQSGAAYQVAEHEKTVWKNVLLWANADLDKNILYLQPRYWKSSDQRWGYTDDLHEDNRSKKTNWWEYSLNSFILENTKEHKKEKQENKIEVKLPDGWTLIDDEFFKLRERNKLNSNIFINYFDGSTPYLNREFIKKLPLRESTNSAIKTISSNENTGKSSMILLSGAGGEGKSTALYQSMIHFYKTWNVIYNLNSKSLPLETIEKLEDDKSCLIVSDDADLVVKDLIKFVKLIESKKRTVHLLLASRETDWIASDGNNFEWNSYISFSKLFFGKLSLKESKDIVSLWSEFGENGLKELYNLNQDIAADKLMKSSSNEENKMDGAFLGAMLKIRFADGLKDHLRTLLNKLETRLIKNTEFTLFDAFSVIALMHKDGLGFLSPPILAEYLFSDSKKDIKGLVINKLGKEAAATPSGEYIYTRHSIIADTVCDLLTNEFNISPIDIYINLASCAIIAREKSFIPPNFKVWEYDFPDYFIKKGDNYTGILIAKKQFEINPTQTFLLTNLAKIYRKTDNFESSVKLFHDFKGDMKGDRVLYHEWATAEGHAGDQSLSVWLNLVSISDNLEKRPPSNDNLKQALAGLCVSFKELYDAYNEILFLYSRYTCATIGLNLKLDDKAIGYFKNDFEESKNLGAKNLKNNSDIINVLEQVSSKIYDEYLEVNIDLLEKISIKNEISFEKLNNFIQK